MSYLAAGMAIASMYSANKKKAAEIQSVANNAGLQRARMKEAATRRAGDFATNKQRAREMAQRAEINIEKQKLMAESKIAETFAGSGISGHSVSELEQEIDKEISEDKSNVKKGLDAKLADMYRQDRQAVSDQASQAEQIGSGAPSQGGVFEAAAAGLQGYAMGSQAETAFNSSSLSKSLGFSF